MHYKFVEYQFFKLAFKTAKKKLQVDSFDMEMFVQTLILMFWVNISDLFRNEITLIRFYMTYSMVVNALRETGGE